MFIYEAFAAGAASNISSIGAPFANFIPLILICIVFYFFIIRPNHKKLKEHRKMINQIKRGDIVVTSGGIMGEVNKVDEANAQLMLEIAPKVEIKVLKSAVSEVLSKETQTKSIEKGKTEKDDKRSQNQLEKSKRGKDSKSKDAS
ncbi:preprotein translocase subunit YajC [Wolbachia endosymbiont of Litomosoides brasiliensis]|uniref:preprotein translocase subunit YajC n=1 Tax=Wolbachia endosymbiont of Litomosoides brasiliensis TaxID=1812117 RepID=UPI001589F41C|nr:preprotein translocase subunit YajC [Wolbachia endosymbiont of Litomosoides brasiliensis]NUY39221.1 preprotein translocase subunit YajC [Wolbachia endosymbiont of Litomosoides brasiliensis]